MPARPLTPIARKLCQNQTDAEKLLWSHLRSRQLSGAKFVRQFPIGLYIADFACRSVMLVIELDGGRHAETPPTHSERGSSKATAIALSGSGTTMRCQTRMAYSTL